MAKALSLKLDEPTYREVEKIRKKLKLPRNTYIRKALATIMPFMPGKCWNGTIATPLVV